MIRSLLLSLPKNCLQNFLGFYDAAFPTFPLSNLSMKYESLICETVNLWVCGIGSGSGVEYESTLHIDLPRDSPQLDPYKIMASAFMQWARSPAARDYFFSQFSSRLNEKHLWQAVGTHFWGPVSVNLSTFRNMAMGNTIATLLCHVLVMLTIVLCILFYLGGKLGTSARCYFRFNEQGWRVYFGHYDYRAGLLFVSFMDYIVSRKYSDLLAFSFGL